MPTHLSRPLRGAPAIALAALMFTWFVAVDARASVPVELRVVDSNGDVLADYDQFTDTVKVKTDRDATCFGPGTAGSGEKVKVDGSTALGAVVDGATAGDRDLRPVSVTDAFDFGLGLCGIGDAVAPSTGFWLLKQNRVESQTGGDLTRVSASDQITWYLDPDFADAPPTELVLDAPQRAQLGAPTEVRVVQYDAGGVDTPAAGVSVTGAAQPTDANGTTTVELTDASQTITATRPGAISDAARICAASVITDCPKHAGGLIGGSRASDKIVGSRGADSIDAGAGKDSIVARDAQVDDIDCGSGKDKVRADREDEIAKNCEKVRD